MFARLMLAAALLAASISAAVAQNMQVESLSYHVFHGTLVRAVGETEDGPLTFPAIELASPLDLSCPKDDELCEPEYSQRLLHLAISGDEAWATFESAVGGPARITGQLYHSHTIHHHTPVLLSVESIEPMERLALVTKAGRYANHPAICTAPEGESDQESALTASVASGSLVVSGYEMSCLGTEAKAQGNADLVSGDCWQEGTPFDTSLRIVPLADDTILVNETLLRACEPAAALPDPTVRNIDLRPPHADMIGYGSRVGMEMTVLDVSGQGTAEARIIAEHTPYNAYQFCALYAGTPDKPCIDETLELRLDNLASANCETGAFTDFFGTGYRFAGASADGDYPDFIINRGDTGEVLDGSSASGYLTTLALYQALCAADELTRPLLDMAGYEAEFDRLRDWRGRSLFNSGGIATLPIVRYATKARPEISPRVWSTLSDARLEMFGHYGFTHRNDASLLIDYARRDILICFGEERVPGQPVTHRFGTMLEGGLDGFDAPCPTSVETALAEYLPLIDDDQNLWVSDLDDDGFTGDWADIDLQPDLLGLGKVIYFDECNQDPEFNPEWFYVWAANRMLQGRFEAGGLLCQIAESRYVRQSDSLDVELVCSTAGFEGGRAMISIDRSPAGRFTVEGERVSQCAAHYFARIEEFGGRGPGAPDPVVTLSMATMPDWSATGPALHKFGDVYVSTKVSGDMDRVVTISGSRGGRPFFEASLPVGHGGFGGIGVFPMGSDGAPWLAFTAYSGGAACCQETLLVDLRGDSGQTHRLGPYYGDLWKPRDLDGDGRFEFVHRDERFSYQFGSAGETMFPPIIHAVEDGVVVDATADRRFRRFVMAEIAQMSAACGGDEGWSMAACFAWAATGTQLGSYQSVMNVLEARMRNADLSPRWNGGDDFASTAATIEAKLIELGYLDR